MVNDELYFIKYHQCLIFEYLDLYKPPYIINFYYPILNYFVYLMIVSFSNYFMISFKQNSFLEFFMNHSNDTMIKDTFDSICSEL